MKKQGFTLIELLIVIAIIGILAAVLIPNLLNARNLAQNRAAQAYGSQVYTALNAFLAEDPGNTITAGSCLLGTATAPEPFVAGSFSVPHPGAAVSSCDITGTATAFQVVVESVHGAEYTFGAAPASP